MTTSIQDKRHHLITHTLRRNQQEIRRSSSCFDNRKAARSSAASSSSSKAGLEEPRVSPWVSVHAVSNHCRNESSLVSRKKVSGTRVFKITLHCHRKLAAASEGLLSAEHGGADSSRGGRRCESSPLPLLRPLLAENSDLLLHSQWLRLTKPNGDAHARVCKTFVDTPTDQGLSGLPASCGLLAVSNRWGLVCVGARSSESCDPCHFYCSQ